MEFLSRRSNGTTRLARCLRDLYPKDLERVWHGVQPWVLPYKSKPARGPALSRLVNAPSRDVRWRRGIEFQAQPFQAAERASSSRHSATHWRCCACSASDSLVNFCCCFCAAAYSLRHPSLYLESCETEASKAVPRLGAARLCDFEERLEDFEGGDD